MVLVKRLDESIHILPDLQEMDDIWLGSQVCVNQQKIFIRFRNLFKDARCAPGLNIINLTRSVNK